MLILQCRTVRAEKVFDLALRHEKKVLSCCCVCCGHARRNLLQEAGETTLHLPIWAVNHPSRNVLS